MLKRFLPTPIVFLLMLLAGGQQSSATEVTGASERLANPFADRWQAAPNHAALKMPGWIVWCGSAIRGDDRRYYLFASRWPEKAGMNRWVTHSEVVVAVADSPVGPYQFERVVLPARGPKFWDGRMTHNPTILRHAGQYVMFYIGVNYEFDPGEGPERLAEDLYGKAWNTKRIGVATAPHPLGPWTRRDKPVLEPRPGKWDGAITSNPSAVIHDDGSVLLLYKSAPVPYPERKRNRRLSFGLARAASIDGPFTRLNPDHPLAIDGKPTNVEDPYIWRDSRGRYHMLAKAMDSRLVPAHTGFYAYSENGFQWRLGAPAQAYDLTVHWENGNVEKLIKKERPQVLLDGDQPIAVFFATRRQNNEIFNLAVPVRPLYKK